ncbi:hypothetical protein CBOM_05201 [Ceraceosorus bombacis]|uniref:Uncharacterized protein n=1 Tax=Ceraceosorus bombacis TaxID=401625 RepID=A0A0P1BIG7_9BASI|nr:hypothetical protein CBOM_05201 [Ceraceosorus bombacis]
MKLSFALLLLAATLATTTLAAPITIYRNGNTEKPMTGQGVRTKDVFPNIPKNDQTKVDPGKNIPAQAPADKPELDCGISCNRDRQNIPPKNQWQLDTDKLPGTGFKATQDGGQPGHAPGHVSLKSEKDMSAKEYREKFEALPWEKAPPQTRGPARRDVTTRGQASALFDGGRQQARMLQARDAAGAPYWLIVEA